MKMNKLVEKFKTIIPTTLVKILFVVALFFSCSLMAFTFINTFNLSNAFITIIVSFGIGLALCAIIECIIFLLPKFIKSNINVPQYFVIFTLLFAIEIAILALCFFFMMLAHPVVMLFVGLVLFIACIWFNILFEYAYFAPLGENKDKILNYIKIYNIMITCIILFIWFVL